MTRTHLLGAASAAALACLSTASHAVPPVKPPITGGGSTLATFDYLDEFSVFNGTKSEKATFSTYFQVGSGTGQQAFITDDLTCDINKMAGTTPCNGTTAGQTGNTVDYGASDATLSSGQISSWATSSFGQSAAGDLIQIPSMGVGVSIPIVNSGITDNEQLAVTDNDLCGIFSGLITDFSQLTNAGSLSGAFQVAYRSDGSGTTFLLTNHLNAVCNTGNTAPGVTFTATTSFVSLFPGGTPSNFSAQSGSNGIASYLSSCSTAGSVPNGIGYLSPDYTTVDASSDAKIKCANGSLINSQLNVASFKTLSNYPTVSAITSGLTHVQVGSNNSPPGSAIDAANPALWVPLVQTVTAGYGIVGYTTFDVAQCYANPNVATAVKAFLKLHYANANYVSYQHTNGFVSLKDTKASTFLTALQADILANKRGFNTDIQNATACAGKVGR